MSSRSRTQAIYRHAEQPRRKHMRLFGYVAVFALLVWLAWQVILSMPPRHLEASSAASAPGARSEALIGQLEARILAADGAVNWSTIRVAAQDILRASPLQSRALFLLGLAAQAEGREDDAIALMDSAARWSLRNRGAHFWLFSHWLAKREIGPALYHADVILRTRPQLGATLLPALMAIAATPEGRTYLVDLFEAGHPWRSWFLREFSKGAADPSDPSPLYATLQSGSSPPDRVELRPHLDRLIGAARFEQALVIWMKSLNADERRDLDYLYNGDFERPISNMPFDWLVSQPRGAEIDLSDSPIGSGKALRIQFGRTRVAFRHVRKLVMLAPGAYQLTGTAKAVGLRNERGLVWTLACAEGAGQLLATTIRITGTMTAEIAEQFTVPQGCRAQWLTLELAARIPSEQDVDGGTVWYDSLRIRRADGHARNGSRQG